jgi:hypothetical protein
MTIRKDLMVMTVPAKTLLETDLFCRFPDHRASIA